MFTAVHLDLSDAIDGEDYWLQALGKRHGLSPHTDQTRAATRACWPQLAAVPDRCLTHFVTQPVAFPADRAGRVHVRHTLRTCPWAKAESCAGNAAIFVPPSLPLRTPANPDCGQHFLYIDYVTTAKTLVFHHPDLICTDAAAARTIHGYMNENAAISLMFETLGGVMRDMGKPTETSGWALLKPFTPLAVPGTSIDGNKTYYETSPTDAVVLAAGDVMTAMLKATKNDASLEGKKWTQATGTSVLNAGAATTGLVGDDAWTPALQTTDEVSGVTAQVTVLDASKTQLQLTLTNGYLRFLGAYIQFIDATGAVMSVPDWTPDGYQDLVATLLDIQYPTIRYIGHIGPQNNILAVPVPPPGTLAVGITFPKGAVGAVIWSSGLGTGANPDPKTPIIGGVLTGVMNLAIPSFMLVAGTAATAMGPAVTILDSLLKNAPFIASVVIPMVQLFTTSGSNGEMKMNWSAFTALFRALFNKAAAQLLIWVEAQMAGEELADEIPFAGWIMVGINIAIGLAQLAETIAEVATSPWNIENRISLTITTSVAVQPDPRHKAFPQGSPMNPAHYRVKMIYRDQSRASVADAHDVPADFTGTTLAASFPNNTLGGQVKFEADFYVGEWLAAKATTGWMNNDAATVATVTLVLVEFPVPLTIGSIYQHAALLTYQNDAYVWQQTAAAPAATIASTNTSPTGNAISVWSGLTLSQRAGMLGFAWKAAGLGITSCVNGTGGQLFALQNAAIPGMGDIAAKFSSCGLDSVSGLVYDPYPPKFEMLNGNWVLDKNNRPVPDPADLALGSYWIDPRKAQNPMDADGGYHLRQVVLDTTTPFDMDAGQPSWGRFRHQPDSVALHPGGYYVGINSAHKRLQIGRLPAAGAADGVLPVARVHAGEALQPQRRGLLFHPVAVACSYDGTIMVLEDTKSADVASPIVLARIQAFDLAGRPVNRFFDADGQPTPFLMLSTTGENTYLDLAVVGDQHMTYLYVLYYGGDGSSPSDYSMAIYQYGLAAPATNPLVTTTGIAAAGIAVDMWHTAYALNYAMTTDGGGNPAGPPVGSAARTVPSVSEWLPPVPTG
ncbi:MAG: hypothetical protein H7Z10_09990 [Gemmatimonadaceae bacterium]|nr:hypothetical protein [Acetobacteraceae bacterium]